MPGDFLESVRNGDWPAAYSLVRTGHAPCWLATPASSVFAWLIELNAPPRLVVEMVGHCAKVGSIDPNRLGLLEACLPASATRSNAFDTFAALLAFGLSPNVITDGGATLLQKAMTLDKVREVTELLRYGVDPNHMSVHGRESTSNREEAALVGNEAGALALAAFGA